MDYFEVTEDNEYLDQDRSPLREQWELYEQLKGDLQYRQLLSIIDSFRYEYAIRKMVHDLRI